MPTSVSSITSADFKRIRLVNQIAKKSINSMVTATSGASVLSNGTLLKATITQMVMVRTPLQCANSDYLLRNPK